MNATQVTELNLLLSFKLENLKIQEKLPINNKTQKLVTAENWASKQPIEALPAKTNAALPGRRIGFFLYGESRSGFPVSGMTAWQ